MRRSVSAPISLFFFNDTPTTEIYTLSLHDALPISSTCWRAASRRCRKRCCSIPKRSEEHTSELQSRRDLVCRLLLEKKKMKFVLVSQYAKSADCHLDFAADYQLRASLLFFHLRRPH